MNFIYVAIVGAFALGMLIGMGIGRKKAYLEYLNLQKQMEATRMWTENLKKYMGGG